VERYCATLGQACSYKIGHNGVDENARARECVAGGAITVQRVGI
jgi:uncharacterized protein (DUF885 family)